ncbi:MAG: hypothetical protein IJM18_07370, partial [Clostridia bacterium]|nr:hypothetical protein [Clostridia bacterium]
MNERTIIVSKKSNALMRIVLVGIGMILAAVLLRVIFPRYWLSYTPAHTSNPMKEPFFYSLFAPRESLDWVISPLLYLGIVAVVVGIIMILAYNKVSLTVTDKRVFGTAAWSKRVDLPFDMISAVATGFADGIAVSTSSGRIQFKCIKNNKEIHAEISKLLLERQSNKAEKVERPAVPASVADEL